MCDAYWGNMARRVLGWLFRHWITNLSANKCCVMCVCVCVCVCARVRVCVCMLVTQLCLTLCDPTDYSLSGACVHEILQARILEWVAIPFSKGYS